MRLKLKYIPTPYKWYLLALVLFIMFAIYTTVFSTGVFLYPTLYIEQWLLHRPLTNLDCVLVEWRQFGEVSASFFLTLVMGVACLFLGYRWRVLPCLLLLLLLGVGIEYGGKQLFPQVIPANTLFGVHSLSCPQMGKEPRSVKLMVALGMWWKAPAVRPGRIRNEQFSATAPLIFDENASVLYGYPSGHAIRWCFLGIVACWLIWRHMKYRLLRGVLMAVALAIAFGGGFAQFYVGLHLSTDLIAGYLVGFACACCAIGLLLQNEKRKSGA